MDHKKSFIELISELDHQSYSMLSKATHDFNGPLTILMGQASILESLYNKGELQSERAKNSIEKVKNSGEYFLTQLDQLRNYYKILNDKASQISVAQINRGLKYYFENLTFSQNITLETSVSDHFNIEKRSPNDLFVFLKILILHRINSPECSPIIIRAMRIDAQRNCIKLNFSLNLDSLLQHSALSQILERLNLQIEQNEDEMTLFLST